MDQLYMYENKALELYSTIDKNNELTTSLKIISELDSEKIANDFCSMHLDIINPLERMKYWVSLLHQ